MKWRTFGEKYMVDSICLIFSSICFFHSMFLSKSCVEFSVSCDWIGEAFL